MAVLSANSTATGFALPQHRSNAMPDDQVYRLMGEVGWETHAMCRVTHHRGSGPVRADVFH